MARGALPDSNPQHLGMPGMHGTVPAVLGLQEADLIIALGARFDDRVTGKASEFAPNAKIVHVDIDPAEIGKIRAADVPIVGDVKDVLVDLQAAFADAAKETKPDYTASGGRGCTSCRPTSRSATWSSDDGILAPQMVIERIGQLSRPRRGLRRGRRPAPDVGGAVHQVRAARTRGSTRAARARWATPSRRRWARRSPSPTVSCGRSTVTAASR